MSLYSRRATACAVLGGVLLFPTGHAAHAQNLQQYLPDVAALAIGEAGAALAPDVTATQRGAAATLPGDIVTTRPHPEYDTTGVHIGDFYIRPQLRVDTGYNTNLFADRSGRGAFDVTAIPSVSFASDWATNSVQGGILAENINYPTNSAQSFTNVTANLGGSYDIGRDKLVVQYIHDSLHIARGTIDSGNFDRPIPFQYDTLHVSYLIPFARLSFEPAIDFSNYRFQNGTFKDIAVIESINDRNVGQATLTTRYELAPLRNLVVVARGVTQNFYESLQNVVVVNTNTGSRTFYNRVPSQNSKSGEILGGIDFNLNAVFRVRALIGYEVRTFTSSSFKTRSAPVIDANVIWSPTELTTVTAGVNRSIEDALSTVTGGYTFTSATLSVDHELLPNVILNGHTQAQLAEFPRNQGSTDIYAAGAKANWQLNRNLALTGRYDYAYRQASASQGNSYAQSIILLGIGLRL